MAQAGIAALTAQLATTQREAADLSIQLAAMQDSAAAPEPKQAAAGLQGTERQAASPCASRPGSLGQYATAGLPPLGEPRSPYRVYSVVLPPPGEAEAASELQELQGQVACLHSALALVEAELTEQLAGKQAAQARVDALQAELEALRQERETLQEQAVTLQQEVSAWQQDSMLRGCPAGTAAAHEAPLERSPSRTLCSRVARAARQPRMQRPCVAPQCQRQQGRLSLPCDAAGREPACGREVRQPRQPLPAGAAAAGAPGGVPAQPGQPAVRGSSAGGRAAAGQAAV